jgi:RNA polymerase sigma-70 factor (ECF subfamily)
MPPQQARAARPPVLEARLMGRFETTRWSVVLRARGEAGEARVALEQLCRTYRPPVLAFVRLRGYTPDAAEDLTQAFFTRFLERAWYSSADPERGRFRSFLLTALKRFLIDSDAEAATLKRGGGIRFELLDDDAGCTGAARETPDAAFEREWAHVVLRAALARLRDEAEQAGKLELFRRLSEFLIEQPGEAEYARAAEDLHLRRNTLAVAVHRMRHRLRDLVREELMETTSNRAELEEELRTLRGSVHGLSQ